jgi:2-oxoglutarate dehydrogenase E1 component
MLCCGEAKWNVKNGLVMLLPHGYEGNGPEHSSARMERYLQLCDEDDVMPKDNWDARCETVNWQVVNCTSAANYFHVLRRQMKRTYRKPLIVIAPKKLLKHRDACSDLAEFGENTKFERVMLDKYDKLVAPEKVKKVIFCSGQVYFDLHNDRVKHNKNDIAIVRLEQLCPFPFKQVVREMDKFKNAEVHWAQEEHKNMGPYNFIRPRFINMLKGARGSKQTEVHYHGRDISASTATGFGKVHVQELQDLVASAMQ